MMLPSIFGNNWLDDWFAFPDFSDFDRAERKLYGRHANRLMKTDVREKDDRYELDIDLPGFEKNEITLDLENGYLTVNAAKEINKDEKDKGVLIRQERYSGSMQRSFYIGEDVKEDDIKAKFDRGVLKLTVPKPEAKKMPEKKIIAIE